MDHARPKQETRRAAWMAGVAALALGSAAAGGASAQTMNASASSFNRGYGWAAGQLNAGVDVTTRDANGNRITIDGVTQIGSDQSVFSTARATGAVDAFTGVGAIGGSTAIGNNLQVSVVGSHNVVNVTSTQINSGNVTASTTLNGKVDIDGNNILAALSGIASKTSRVRALGGVSALAVSVTGCVSPVAGPHGLYASPIGNAPVTSNATPYSAALVCLSQYAGKYGVKPPRIAVGRIADYTGKAEDDGGRKITQGASLMAMSALAKAGVPLVERYDTSVSEMELKYANNKLISDEPAAPPGTAGGPNAPAKYRKIVAGQVPGSDFYLVGGITELNYNIRSSGANVQGVDSGNPTNATGLLSGKLYVMNVALDLRLVETKTLDVVDVVSYQKQIIGREVGAGLFKMFGTTLVDASAGEGGLEPVQLAVRATLERAVVEMMANIYGAPGPEACLSGGDPLGGPNATTGITGGYIPAYNNLEQNNGATREDPARWHAKRDPAVDAALRGRY